MKLVTEVPLITKKDFNGATVINRNSYTSFAKDFPTSLFTNKLLAAHLAANNVAIDGKCKLIMITSPKQGCGKTHISSNLASLSALLGAKTLLIDLDARKNTQTDDIVDITIPSELNSLLKTSHLEEIFSLTRGAEVGAYDILRIRASKEAACLRFFQSQAMDLLSFVRRNYEYAWIDTPPAGIFNDPLITARHVDGVMVVAAWSKTTIKQLKDTINLIQESNGNVLGVIINKVRVDRLISESMASYANYYSGKKNGGHLSAA